MSASIGPFRLAWWLLTWLKRRWSVRRLLFGGPSWWLRHLSCSRNIPCIPPRGGYMHMEATPPGEADRGVTGSIFTAGGDGRPARGFVSGDGATGWLGGTEKGRIHRAVAFAGVAIEEPAVVCLVVLSFREPATGRH
jgi:hypothetical protein